MATETEAPVAIQFGFKDPLYSFQALRTVSATNGAAADIGECLVAVNAIKEGDDESWYREWLQLAERLEEHAHQCKNRGHLESARTALLRASNYYRTAEFLLHTNPSDPRIVPTWKKSRDTFREMSKLSHRPIIGVRMPFENTFLPGYLCFAAKDNVRRPLLLIQTGFDGTAEELYYQIAQAALLRGYNCLLFEGPGQGEVIREQRIPFRNNWETVITRVVDYIHQLKNVDMDRIALIGISFGGYLVPRALAFEQRIKVGIANGGVYDFHQVCMRGKVDDNDLDNPTACAEIDNAIREEMKNQPMIRWGVGNGMFTFGASSPTEWLRMTRPYHLKDVAHNIKARMLIIDSDHDEDMPGQSKQLYEALKCQKDYLQFTSKEGAGEHCQIGAYAFSNENILDWLDEVL